MTEGPILKNGRLFQDSIRKWQVPTSQAPTRKLFLQRLIPKLGLLLPPVPLHRGIPQSPNGLLEMNRSGCGLQALLQAPRLSSCQKFLDVVPGEGVKG